MPSEGILEAARSDRGADCGVTGSRLEGSLWSFASIAARISSAGAVGGATSSRRRHFARWRAPPSRRRSSTIRIRLTLPRTHYGRPLLSHTAPPCPRSNGWRRPSEDARRQPRNALPRLCPRSRCPAHGDGLADAPGAVEVEAVDAVIADHAGGAGRLVRVSVPNNASLAIYHGE